MSMRVAAVALLALFFPLSAALAEEDESDSWVGCWSHTYDAAHLAKHPGQLVTALTLSISPHTGSSDSDSDSDSSTANYSAKVIAKLRGKTETYENLDSALCAPSGNAKDHLTCAGTGIFLDGFRLVPAAKNMRLAMKGGDEHIALMPGIDISAFFLLSPDNPEHALFLLQPAPGKTCGL
jgi:hypothetical protein